MAKYQSVEPKKVEKIKNGKEGCMTPEQATAKLMGAIPVGNSEGAKYAKGTTKKR